MKCQATLKGQMTCFMRCIMNMSLSIIRQQGTMAEVNPFRCRGYYDTEMGFYYLQTRYYDPSICRFINADNYELVATLSSVLGELNMYSY